MRIVAALIATGLLGAAVPPSDPPHPVSGPERAAILQAAREPAEQTLSKPVKFKVDRLAVEGRWAFLRAAMQGPDGAPLSFAGTPKAEAQAQGLVSRDYVALLSKSEAGWSVVAQLVGPTDQAWKDWPQTYGAPADLVGGP